MQETTKQAKPTKLNSGAWGAMVAGPVAVGDVVTIVTAGGKSWQAKVTAIVSAGAETVCKTVSMDRKPAASGRRIASDRKAWGQRRGMGSGHGSAVSMSGYSSYCTDNDYCRCYDCAS